MIRQWEDTPSPNLEFEGASPKDVARALLNNGMHSNMASPEPLKVIAGASDRPLQINDFEIPCYVLEDETRVLTRRGFLRAIGRSPRSGTPRDTAGAHQLPAFLVPKSLKAFVPNNLRVRTNLIEFSLPHGGVANGYDARLLRIVCEVYLVARQAGALRAGQEHLAERAEVLIRGMADIGIVALVDEATGYERIREKRALAKILERYLTENALPWTRTFPFSLYEQIFRLRGWGKPTRGVNHPQVIGHYTNNIIYARVAPGVLKELRKRNPTISPGQRKKRHHQWFTKDLGHPKLKEHLAAVIALMRISSTWRQFIAYLDRAFPQIDHTYEMPLDDLDNESGADTA